MKNIKIRWLIPSSLLLLVLAGLFVVQAEHKSSGASSVADEIPSRAEVENFCGFLFPAEAKNLKLHKDDGGQNTLYYIKMHLNDQDLQPFLAAVKLPKAMNKNRRIFRKNVKDLPWWDVEAAQAVTGTKFIRDGKTYNLMTDHGPKEGVAVYLQVFDLQ
jgi:hypothetical protein